MEYVQKVLWHEGMLLTPNHFQQADRHAEAIRSSLVRMLEPKLRGVATLEIDAGALSSEAFALRRCSGVFPDGTVFNMPDGDALPASKPFAKRFDGRIEKLGVHLVLPELRAGSPSCDDPARPGTVPVRFQRRAAELRDDVAGGTQRPIETAVKDLGIRFDGEALDGYTSLRIAEIVRSSSGGYALNEEFVPPCVLVSASPMLLRVLRRIVDILCARSSELSMQRRQRTQGMVEFSVSETANYSLLHTINGTIPGLMHLLAQPQAHPERLFLELSRLAGLLHTYASEGHPKDLPAYQHDDLGATFLALDARLRALLETNITVRYVSLPLVRGNGGIFASRLPEAVLDGHRLYLSVVSSAPSEKIIGQTSQKAKIAASGRINTLIAQALKGLGLTYLSVPPGEIPAQPGSSYFELQRSGDEWKQAVETRTLSVFLPPDFTDLKMEFMAVKE
jgi:type VI secretion system protein ImpJ